MKYIIAGSRSLSNLPFEIFEKEILNLIEEQSLQISEVVSGTAIGPDVMGEKFAEKNKIPITRFTPDWKKFGKKAGILRNIEMSKYADVLICVWDGKSKGSRHMIDVMEKEKKPVYIIEIKNDAQS